MGTRTFQNLDEVYSYFQNILDEIVDIVSIKLLDDFREHLEDTVYAPKEGNYTRYYKNGGFYSGWYVKKIKECVREMAFDGSRLVAPSDDYLNSQMAHGGSSGGDQRGKMAWILNDMVANYDYSYNGGAYYLRNQNEGYWDSYIKELESKLDRWFDIEFKKYGITRG